MQPLNYPIFKVDVLLSIWNQEERDVREFFDNDEVSLLENRPTSTTLGKKFELPFVPFEGLALQSKDWECSPLVYVKWVEEDWTFRCHVPDEYPRQELDIYISQEDLISKRLEEGWELTKFSPRMREYKSEQ